MKKKRVIYIAEMPSGSFAAGDWNILRAISEGVLGGCGELIVLVGQTHREFSIPHYWSRGSSQYILDRPARVITLGDFSPDVDFSTQMLNAIPVQDDTETFIISTGHKQIPPPLAGFIKATGAQWIDVAVDIPRYGGNFLPSFVQDYFGEFIHHRFIVNPTAGDGDGCTKIDLLPHRFTPKACAQALQGWPDADQWKNNVFALLSFENVEETLESAIRFAVQHKRPLVVTTSPKTSPKQRATIKAMLEKAEKKNRLAVYHYDYAAQAQQVNPWPALALVAGDILAESNSTSLSGDLAGVLLMAHHLNQPLPRIHLGAEPGISAKWLIRAGAAQQAALDKKRLWKINTNFTPHLPPDVNACIREFIETPHVVRSLQTKTAPTGGGSRKAELI